MSFSLPSRAAALLAVFSLSAIGTAAEEARWYKGNLHTHSLWSDGNDYPEMIADWYKAQGYNFLALSDHNVLQEGERWLELKAPVSIKGEVNQRGGSDVLKRYIARFGNSWVQQREVNGKQQVRLKPLAEYRVLLEEPGRFLMIPSEEVTSAWKQEKTATEPERGGPVHINLTNPRDFVAPAPGRTALEIMQATANTVRDQREKTGQPMFLHLNHPNFVWGVTAEELMQVHHEKFFEIYNGHPGVNNAGDETRLGTEAMWDAILTRRLAELKLGVMYGLGVDDSHNYHQFKLGTSNPGRGWVMVRAKHLTPESIVNAMEAGDFYASSGVTLRDIRSSERELTVEIVPEAGVTYTIQFIGTRRGYDARSELMQPPAGSPARKGLPHRRYSRDVGAVLAESAGTRATYMFRGDEIYVRGKITSSKPKPNASVEGETECAWIQPVVVAARQP